MGQLSLPIQGGTSNQPKKRRATPRTTVSSQKKELISHKATLWAELQQAAKEYEDRVYEKFLQLMLKADPNGNWKSKSRRNFFIDFFNWRSTAANNKLGANIPKNIFPTGNNPIDPKKFVTTIQLSKYREEQVESADSIASQIGYYAEQYGEDYLAQQIKSSINSKSKNKRTFHGPGSGKKQTVTFKIEEGKNWVYDTVVKGQLKGTDTWTSMYLDHKHYKQATSLTNFSVTEGSEKTIELDSTYYGLDAKPWNKIKDDKIVREALVIEVLHDKYKNAQPFFYAANVPDDIIMPSEFFKKQSRFTLTKAKLLGDQKEINEKIDEEVQRLLELYADEFFTEEDMLKEATKNVMEDVKRKLYLSEYQVMFKR